MKEWRPGDDPADLWHPALAHLYGLRPCDMRDLTPEHMRQIKKYTDGLAGE